MKKILTILCALFALSAQTSKAIATLDITVDQDNAGVHLHVGVIDLEPDITRSFLFIDGLVYAHKIVVPLVFEAQNATEVAPYDIYGLIPDLGSAFTPGTHDVKFDYYQATTGDSIQIFGSFTIATFDVNLPSTIPGLPVIPDPTPTPNEVPDTNSSAALLAISVVLIGAGRKFRRAQG